MCVCVLLSEVMAFSCFTELMKRMNQNFPHGGAMDSHFANMRSLIQVCACTYVHEHMYACMYTKAVVYWWTFCPDTNRSWTLSCLNWCSRMETILTSTSVIVGFCSTSKEVMWKRGRHDICLNYQIKENFYISAYMILNVIWFLSVFVHRNGVWWCVLPVGNHLGGQVHLLWALCALHCSGTCGDV